MSLQNALLGESTNEQGLYDAQVHSLQIYKTPTLPTDVVNLSHYSRSQIPPFIEYVNMNNLLPDLNLPDGNVYILESRYGGTSHPLYGVVPGLPYFDRGYWTAGGIGFSNDGDDVSSSFVNGQYFYPTTTTDPAGNAVWAVVYKRTYLNIPVLGLDNIWAQVVLNDVVI